MKIFIFRIKQLLLGWGFVGVIYNLADHLQGPGRLITPLWIDAMIPFSSSGIWAYLSFFLIIPLGYTLAPLNAVRWFARSMQMAALGAGAVYLIWPTTLLTPSDMGQGISSILTERLIALDSTQNCLPSLHITLTTLAIWVVAKKRCGKMTLLFVTWGVAIAFSILQLKRHLFIDLIGGLILAVVAGAMAQWISTKQKERCCE